MKGQLQILSFLTVFSCVLMTSGGVFEGTEGENVEISCSYPDEYKYEHKYFCRHPCSSSDHVLIKSEKSDVVNSKGRYSCINTVSARSFSVLIRDLRRSDSGVYYCGVDKWFTDKLSKVQLTVKPAPVSRSSHTTKGTHISSIWTTTNTSAVINPFSPQNNSSVYEQLSSTVHYEKHETPFQSSVITAVACAAVLVLLLLTFTVALVCFSKKRSDSKSTSLNPPTPENPVQRSPDHNQTADDIYHIYDEMISDSSAIYSTVRLCDPAPQVDSPYSLVTHH